MLFTEQEYRAVHRAAIILRSLLDYKEITPVGRIWEAGERERKINEMDSVLEKIGSYGKNMNHANFEFNEVKSLIDALEITHIMYSGSKICYKKLSDKDRYVFLKRIQTSANKLSNLCKQAVSQS